VTIPEYLSRTDCTITFVRNQCWKFIHFFSNSCKSFDGGLLPKKPVASQKKSLTLQTISDNLFNPGGSGTYLGHLSGNFGLTKAKGFYFGGS
jgi:hypothetical protein